LRRVLRWGGVRGAWSGYSGAYGRSPHSSAHERPIESAFQITNLAANYSQANG